jgi:signal transduction histidine kinase
LITIIRRALGSKNSFMLVRQMKDYATAGKNLIWQRWAIFSAALLLTAYYYSLQIALVTAVLIGLSELYDSFVFKRVLAWNGRDAAVARKLLNGLYVGTVLSASVIVFYAVALAIEQGPGTHFMSLFFLFAAALFAAMNNHQLLPVLIMRMVLYGIAFIFIPLWGIYETRAPFDSELWAQMFTSLFVMYFVIDCSRIYLSLYRRNLDQLEALRAENRKSQEAYKAKTEFVSTMSHELRTPLTSIKGSIDLACAGHLGPLSDRAGQVMAIAQRNCTRLIVLIDEILDLQKIEAGRMHFSMTEFDITQMIEQAIASSTPFAGRLGVQLVFEGADQPILVHGDPARIEQVLANMVSNAAKFSPEGSCVRIGAVASESSVRVSVIDEGSGLSEDDHDRVFDKFSQIDSSDTRKIGGSGLGMNISKQIIQAHGGNIDYSKNPDRGTTFYFDLSLEGTRQEKLDPVQVAHASL